MLEILVLALGIALSPFPVVPAILLLFTARPRPTSLAFLGGWLAGVGGATVVAVLVAGRLELPGASPTWLSWARAVLGAGLVVVGVRRWLSRGDVTEPPAWIRTLQDATPATATRLALVLSVANPKVVLLAVAAGLDIAAADVGAAGVVGGVVLFTVVASLGVAVPVLGYAVRGDAFLPPLERAKDWLLRNTAAVMAVVLVLLGLLLLKNGVSALV